MYKAHRTAVNIYEIYSGQDLVGRTSFTDKFAVWTAEDAPLTGVVQALGAEAFPILEIDGVKYTARKKLLASPAGFAAFLYNNYTIRLENSGTSVIDVLLIGNSWAMTINYKGEKFFLKRKSLFSFRYVLTRENGSVIAAFHDTTPFLTVSIRRDFAIDVKCPLDNILITVAFWLAVNNTFR